MLKEYVLPVGFRCPECAAATAFAVIIDASHDDAPIICNECGFEYGSVGELRRALKNESVGEAAAPDKGSKHAPQ
jgi:transcription elongation factor Elf1